MARTLTRSYHRIAKQAANRGPSNGPDNRQLTGTTNDPQGTEGRPTAPLSLLMMRTREVGATVGRKLTRSSSLKDSKATVATTSSGPCSVLKKPSSRRRRNRKKRSGKVVVIIDEPIILGGDDWDTWDVSTASTEEQDLFEIDDDDYRIMEDEQAALSYRQQMEEDVKSAWLQYQKNMELAKVVEEEDEHTVSDNP